MTLARRCLIAAYVATSLVLVRSLAPRRLHHSALRLLDKGTDVTSNDAQQQVANMALASLTMAVSATAELRHMLSSVYRQVKLDERSRFYEDVRSAMGHHFGPGKSDAAASRSLTPDSVTCHSLLNTARDFLSTTEQLELNKYLETLVPGTPRAEYEVKGCWIEPVPNQTYRRLLFALGDRRAEDLLVAALEVSGSAEVQGTAGPGAVETAARHLLQDFVSGADGPAHPM